MAGFTKLHNAVVNNPLPWTVRQHPEWPVVDVSSVKDANGNEVCTVYADNSPAVAELIVQAYEAFIGLLPSGKSEAA